MACSNNWVGLEGASITMPPGVLQEALVPGHYYDLSIKAFPENWDIRVDEGEDGCPYYPLTKDLDIIYELQMAVDEEIYRQTLEDENRITSELEWMEIIAYSQSQSSRISGPYFFIDEGQFYGSLLGMRALMLTEIEIAVMDQFEEDYDYEQSLIDEKKTNMNVNLHRLLATPFDRRPGWCGYVGHAASGRDNEDWSFHKERYRWQVEIVHNHPSGKSGYALGKTDYGYIYIPEKFRGYIPETGSTIDVTVALQDVGDGDKKGNAFRFTAIYTH